MLDTGKQGFEFLSAVYAGIIIGIFYDICRIIRRICQNKCITNAIIDTVFWIGTGLITFAAMYIINGSRPRWYLFAGLFLGSVLHFYSLGIIINYIWQKIYIICKNRHKSKEVKHGQA